MLISFSASSMFLFLKKSALFFLRFILCILLLKRMIWKGIFFSYLFSFLLIGRLAQEREIGANCYFVFDFAPAKWEIGAGNRKEDELSGAFLASLSSCPNARVPLGFFFFLLQRLPNTWTRAMIWQKHFQEIFWVKKISILCLYSALELKKHFLQIMLLFSPGKCQCWDFIQDFWLCFFTQGLLPRPRIISFYAQLFL